MPDTSIGLTEAIKLIKGGAANLQDPRLSDFISRVDEMSTTVLKEKDNEYLIGAIALLQAATIAVMLDQGTVSVFDALQLATDPTFEFIVGITFKLSVGLAAIEELR